MTNALQADITVDLESNFSPVPGKTVGIVNPMAPPDPPETWVGLVRGLNSGDGVADFYGIATDHDQTFIAVGSDGRASISVDSGINWTGLIQGLNSGLVTAAFRAIRGSTGGVFIACGLDGRAARTTDGVNWSALVKGLGAATNTDFNWIGTDNNGTWIACGGSSEVGFSTDDGVTWNNGGTIGGLGSVSYNGLISQGTLWTMVSDNGGAGQSVNSGLNFGDFLSPQGLNCGDTNEDFETIASNGSSVYIVGGRQGRASRTDDSGTTWVGLPRFLDSGGSGGSDGFLRLHSDTFGNWVCVQNNGFVGVSTDEGLNWTDEVPGLNSGNGGADFRGVVTNRRGVWVAVALSGWCSRGT